MEFYVMIDGKLVKATRDQILDITSVLYDAEGKLLGRITPKTTPDPVAELTAVIKDMAVQTSGLNALKEAKEQAEAENARLREQISKGFVMNGERKIDTNKYIHGYEISKQGRDLTDKSLHPGHQITEEKRIELAKYFCTFIKAAYFKDPEATKDFNQNYQRKTGTTDIGDTGSGWFVPDIVESEILAFARESSIALTDARVVSMISEKQSYPAESSGVAVTWGNTTNESDPVVAEVELSAVELSAYSAAKKTTLADSRSDIVGWLTELMANAVGLELDNVMFNGDGTSTYAFCSGILSAACGYSVVMGAGSTSFSKITTTLFSEAISKLDGLKKQGAKFYMNGAAFHYVRDLKDAVNRPIFYDTLGGTGTQSGTILGYPYREAIKITATDAANTAYFAFGNLKNFLIGNRLDSMGLDIDPYGLWTTNRIRLKIYNRWALSMGLTSGFVRGLTHS
jgi:HK97 family phage major capsid protein